MPYFDSQLTVKSSALAILKATGLEDKLGELLSISTELAERVVIIAQDVTQSTDLTTVVDVVQFDDALSIEVQKALIDQLILPDKSTVL